MLTIRIFEERLLSLFQEGLIFGTTHTCMGQEATAVALVDNLNNDDVIFSNHRCHGHYLARFGDVKSLLAELMGRQGGVCGGRGGSQHLCRENFYTNGIQGGFMPVAVGTSLALKNDGEQRLAVIFIGDGTLGQGVVYESLNLAALWRVPLLIIVENNFYAQTTPVELALSGSITKRADAFGILADEIESNDVETLHGVFAERVKFVRDTQTPFLQVVKSYRLGPHSKGDDFRSQKEIDSWWERDPISLCKEKIGLAASQEVEKQVRISLRNIEREVISSPFSENLKLDKVQ